MLSANIFYNVSSLLESLHWNGATVCSTWMCCEEPWQGISERKSSLWCQTKISLWKRLLLLSVLHPGRKPTVLTLWNNLISLWASWDQKSVVSLFIPQGKSLLLLLFKLWTFHETIQIQQNFYCVKYPRVTIILTVEYINTREQIRLMSFNWVIQSRLRA